MEVKHAMIDLYNSPEFEFKEVVYINKKNYNNDLTDIIFLQDINKISLVIRLLNGNKLKQHKGVLSGKRA